MVLNDSPLPCRYLIHDRDGCFVPLDGILEPEEDMTVVRTPAQCPRCNAFAERHIREIRETLDNIILVGERHLHSVLRKIQKHHNESRPHQGLGNVVPEDFDYPAGPVSPDEVRCESQLGGLLNHYRRAA